MLDAAYGVDVTARILLSLLIALCISSAYTPAGAAGGHEEIFIRKGVELRKKGRNQEALAEFQKAFDVAHTPRAAAQLGLCEQSLSNWLPAQLHLTDALASESDTWVSQHRDTLERSRAEVEKHLGRVTVQGKPASAMVVVGGDVVGRLSDAPSVFVVPGAVLVTVTNDGFVPFKETRQVEAGAVASIDASLAVLPAAVAAEHPVETSHGPATHDASLSASAVTEPPANEGKVGAWVGWGAGAALVGAGVVFGVRAASKAEEARTAEVYSAAAEDSANSSRTLQWVCLGAGAVSIAAGTLLYFRSSQSTEVSLAPTQSGNGPTLVWQGRW